MDTLDLAERLTLIEPVGSGIRRIMVSQLDLALLALEGINPDVHAARKALKRTRGLLRLVRDPIGEPAYRGPNEAIRDAGQLLAPLRDAAATIETFDTVVARHPRCLELGAIEDIHEALWTNERDRHADLVDDPRGIREVTATITDARGELLDLSMPMQRVSDHQRFDLIEPGLRRTYRQCRRGLASAVDDPSDESFHRWRKAVKYLRYQLEALVAYSPATIGGQIRELDELGEALGAAQDLVVLSHALDSAIGNPATADGRPTDRCTLLAAMADDLGHLHATALPIGEALFVDKPRRFASGIRNDFEKPLHAAIALAIYGIVGTASPLPSELDDLARIDGANGTTYVLRISPHDADPATLDLITASLTAAATAALPVPRIVMTLDGRDRETLAGGRIVSMQTWLNDGAHGSSDLPPHAAASMGRIAGALVEALANVPAPAELRPDRQWDLTQAPTTISSLRHTLPDDLRRAIIDDVYERIAHIPFHELPHQVIHNDLNPENLLIANDDVVGVIDFGDVAWTVRIGELAIACAYAMLDQDDPVEVASTIARAYGRTTAVTTGEAKWLFHLIIARLATSACIAAGRPDDNPHHQNTTAGVWTLLATLLAADTGWMSACLAAACLDEAPPSDPSAPRHLLRGRSTLGSTLSLSYASPLNIVRGGGAFLYDERARRYLDGVNNVAHVGHAHPLVVEAAHRQMSILNTNTRYLHPEVNRYAARLAATLPDELDTVFVVNSGSEANELAIRLARTATGRTDLVCLDHGYHGNTNLLIDVSPYKFDGPGGLGRPDGVSVLPSPDPYRHPIFSGGDAGARYRHQADAALIRSEPAALIAEALPGCGGQVVPAPGVMAAAYGAVRDAGGIVIADEIQTGLGRVGTDFWAFQLHGVTPDIVTVGKPAGNGHPLAAVVTTASLADAFNTGMEYFNTFGGNPVSAAVGNAVLDVIEESRLQAWSRILGEHLLQALTALMDVHSGIGDVRGAGLFLGVELVKDRSSRRPDPHRATGVVEFSRHSGVLLNTDGPHHNVIKIKPPLIISAAHAERFAATIDAALVAVR